MTTTLYLDSDAETPIFADPTAEGYVADKHGLLCKGEFGYCEPILRYKASWYTVDGYDKPSTKTFKDPVKLVKFLRAEEFLNDGGVSDDGITRFSGVMVSTYEKGNTTFFTEIRISTLLSLTK